MALRQCARVALSFALVSLVAVAACDKKEPPPPAAVAPDKAPTEAAADKPAADEAPTEAASDEAAADEAPTEAAGDEAAADEAAGDEAPADEAAGDEVAPDEAAGDEVAADEAAGDEAAADEAPTEAAAADEAAGDEAAAPDRDAVVIAPALVVDDIAAAIAHYTLAFGAEVAMVVPAPDGKPVHAEVTIGDSTVLLVMPDASRGLKSPTEAGGTVGSLNLAVPDADATIAKAVAAGAKVVFPATDTFWGQRYGMVVDPFGHAWGVGTTKVNLTAEQIAAGAKVAFLPDQEAAAAAIAKIWAEGEPAESHVMPGYPTVTASLHLNDAVAALDSFYVAGLGGEDRGRMAMPDGKLMHADVAIGQARVMFSEAMEAHGTKSPKDLEAVTMYLYVLVPDVDARVARAAEAGGTVGMPVADMFWGHRAGVVVGPSGHVVTLATWQRDVSADEMAKAIAAMMGPQ